MQKEMYISLDIETDGPCPGQNSMLALGAVAFLDGEENDFFYRKIEPLDDAMQDSDTMVWWAGQPEAWEEVNKDREEPMTVMNDFGVWLEDFGENVRLMAVAKPATFDFGFINWYLHSYYGDNPLGFACMDIRSYANGLFSESSYYGKLSVGDPYKFFDIDKSVYRPHFAVDDARKQGVLLMKLLELAADIKRDINNG
jgi:DNA polymerase III alpha subunit (gram-positive type)